MNAAQKMLKSGLSAIIERIAEHGDSVIDSLTTSQAKHIAKVYVQAHSGACVDLQMTRDVGRHLEIDEIRISTKAQVEAADARADECERLAREAVENYESMRRERDEALELVRLSSQHPDYTDLLRTYKRLLARSLDKAWTVIKAKKAA